MSTENGMPATRVHDIVRHGHDRKLANELANKLGLIIGTPMARELCRIVRKNRITDAIREDNSCGTEVVEELMRAFEKVRSDERAKTVEMVEGWL